MKADITQQEILLFNIRKHIESLVFLLFYAGQRCTYHLVCYAKSKGKLCAFLSCITSIPKSARFIISAQLEHCHYVHHLK